MQKSIRGFLAMAICSLAASAAFAVSAGGGHGGGGGGHAVSVAHVSAPAAHPAAAPAVVASAPASHVSTPALSSVTANIGTIKSAPPATAAPAKVSQGKDPSPGKVNDPVISGARSAPTVILPSQHASSATSKCLDATQFGPSSCERRMSK
ncbi:hypothetical protein Lumi_090 [Xylophilus phage Lumi]|nr:hypothetical protein Lumi_090 [Xylophilus phage Lumi]